MSDALRTDVENVLDWFENEPELWAVIITGTGRAFCVGADLKSWNKAQTSGSNKEIEELTARKTGFGSVSRRSSNKPILAAVNGHALGGGLEMVVNCDIVIASEDAKFSLPEVKVGVVAAAGGIPRLLAIAGRQRGSELLLTGREIGAKEAYERFGFVNKVVPRDQVLSTTINYAKSIIANSPDAVRSTKRAINESYLTGNVEEAFQNHISSPESKAVYSGKNIQEGLKAFSQKRRPKWVSSKL